MSYYVLKNVTTNNGYYYSDLKRSNPLEKCFIWNDYKKAEKMKEKIGYYHGEQFEIVEVELKVV